MEFSLKTKHFYFLSSTINRYDKIILVSNDFWSSTKTTKDFWLEKQKLKIVVLMMILKNIWKFLLSIKSLSISFCYYCGREKKLMAWVKEKKYLSYIHNLHQNSFQYFQLLLFQYQYRKFTVYGVIIYKYMCLGSKSMFPI